MSDPTTETVSIGEGFAFFRWASLVTAPGLTYYPGTAVIHVWASDWPLLPLKRVIYGW